MTAQSLWSGPRAGRGLAAASRFDLPSAQAFRDNKKGRDPENSEHGCRDHAAKNRGPDGVARGRTAALSCKLSA
jgi:hypothetical protein